MSSMQVNGISLWSETQGASGSPVVLVHGSWGDHHNWDLVAPQLAEAHTVVTYDRRGHSQSERPTSPGSIHEDVADLAALIETTGIAPAHVIGNSAGAIVSLRLAADRPELIRSLVVHEPPLVGVISDDPAMASILRAFDAVARGHDLHDLDLVALGAQHARDRLGLGEREHAAPGSQAKRAHGSSSSSSPKSSRSASA
jgi:pimeloyl-ACP methyl ester carboxylesterase